MMTHTPLSAPELKAVRQKAVENRDWAELNRIYQGLGFSMNKPVFTVVCSVCDSCVLETTTSKKQANVTAVGHMNAYSHNVSILDSRTSSEQQDALKAGALGY
jgi:hypothetical protein